MNKETKFGNNINKDDWIQLLNIGNIMYLSALNFEDLDDEVVDDLLEWFSTCGIMTEEQIKAIENKDWNKLINLI